MNTTNIDHSTISGYKLYLSIRDNRKGDGVELDILDAIHCSRMTNVLLVDNNIIESCFVNIGINYIWITLVELYGIPGTNIKKYRLYMEMIKYLMIYKKH